MWNWTLDQVLDAHLILDEIERLREEAELKAEIERAKREALR